MIKIFLLFTLYGFSVSADLTSDLERIDIFLGPSELCQAFPNGERKEYLRKSCFSTWTCDQYSYYISSQCFIENNQEKAIIEHVDKKGSVYSRQTLGGDQWYSLNGNIFRQYVKNVESFGKRLEIREIRESEDQLIVEFQILSSKDITEEGTWILRRGDYFQNIYSRESQVLKPFKEYRSDLLINY